MLIPAVNLKLDLFNKQLFNTLKSFHRVKSDDTILFKLTILQAQRAQNVFILTVTVFSNIDEEIKSI